MTGPKVGTRQAQKTRKGNRILTRKAYPSTIAFSPLKMLLVSTSNKKGGSLSAYTYGRIDKVSKRLTLPTFPTHDDEIERAKRYLEVKAMSVTFNENAEEALLRTGLFFERAHRHKNIICDFLLPGPPHIAVDCKYNLNRGWDRTVTSVKFLKEHLDLEIVLIVVPYENGTTLAEADRIIEQGGKIVSVADLEVTLKLLCHQEGGKQ